MKTATFHKILWDHDLDTGVGKLHYPGFGIIAFYWDKGTPISDVNFLNKDEMKMYSQSYQKEAGKLLTHGYVSERDKNIVIVQEKKYTVADEQSRNASAITRIGANQLIPQGEGIIYGIKSLNLMIKVEEGIRYLADTDGSWYEFDEDTPYVPYSPLKSLLGLDYGIKSE